MDPKALFANLSPDALPAYASVAEVLSSIEDELGEEARNELEAMLNGHELPDTVNVRELLREIQEQLGEPYFEKFLKGSGSGSHSGGDKGDHQD